MDTIKALTPIGDRVIIRCNKPEEKIGSLYIPPNAQEQMTMGTIVAISRDLINENTVITMGQQVLYKQYSGDEITVDGINYIIVSEDDILGVMV